MQLAQAGFESTPVTLDDLMGDNGDAFGLKVSAPVNGSLRLEFTKLPLSALARILGSYLRQPVFDRTGLNGRYQGELEFSVQSADDPRDNSLFSSLQSVGLKLERSKVPVKLIIVDHAEQVPTEN